MKRQIQIVILCGGLGTRLGEYTQNCPKPLLPVQGRPFLDYIISHFIFSGYRHFHLLCHHHFDQFVSYQSRLNQCENLDAKVEVYCEPTLLGTAGALSFFLPNLSSSVDGIICCNGDSLNDIDLNQFVENCHGQMITIGLTRQADPHQRFGKVCKDDAGFVTAFLEKQMVGSDLVNAGLYYIPRSCFGYFNRAPFSMEKELFPMLIEQKKLLSHFQAGTQFVDMGILDELNRLQTSDLQDRLAF